MSPPNGPMSPSTNPGAAAERLARERGAPASLIAATRSPSPWRSSMMRQAPNVLVMMQSEPAST